MKDIDEAMDEKLDRLERENANLREQFEFFKQRARAAYDKHQAEKQELLDALGVITQIGYVTAASLQFARDVFSKHKESMT